MSNLTKLVKALKSSQEALGVIEEFGIDVDRLIGISNAQGPLAKLVRSVMLGNIDIKDPVINQHLGPLVSSPTGEKLLSGKKRSSVKRTASKK